MTREKIENCRQEQVKILDQYSGMTRVGGRMVYATCSVLPCENEKQIQAFLERNKGRWRTIKERHYWPDSDGYDGFYASCLERTN